MSTHKPFREIIPDGTNFEFIGTRRRWVTISILLCVATIALLFVNSATRGSMLNWSIDFKGGTELIFQFEGDREVTPGDVRNALKASGVDGVEVSEFKWDEKDEATGQTVRANGIRVRTPEYGAIQDAEAEELAGKFETQFADRKLSSLSWSGDTLFVRSEAPITWEEVQAFFATAGKELRPWGESAEDYMMPVEGTKEYRLQFSIRGLDAQYEQVLTQALEGVEARTVQSYGVGAKAGEQLRNDGLKSLFYAVALIMLYLAFRFDVRYAPGAVVALLHDALLVVGAFAVTWSEFSLTTVAALLTVIGYSVNDTVVIFDRIRENVAKLKDKKFDRVINISLNETLSRTLLTSLTLFVVTLMMNIFGTGLVRNFAFAMNIGVIVGVYSSIFIAAPVALAIHNKYFATAAK